MKLDRIVDGISENMVNYEVSVVVLSPDRALRIEVQFEGRGSLPGIICEISYPVVLFPT